MTERSLPASIPPPRRLPSSPQPARRRRLRAWPTVAAAIATFAVLFEFLAFQLSSGNDPALGADIQANAPAPQQQPVLNRRIVKTRVVHDPPVVAPGTTSSAPAVTAVPTAPAPTTSAPAPVAPAPAPAPPVTSTS
jgi:hypothetical protein